MEDFDKFADDYKAVLDKSLASGGETGEYFSTYKVNCVRRYIGSGFRGKILDYGCGIGLLSKDLLSHFPQASLDGYDVSQSSLEHVPEYLKKQGRFTSDLDTLNKEYDLVVVANVFHHIEPSQRLSVMAKLYRLIKKNGRIIIFEHNPFNPVTRKIVKESPLDRGVVLLPFSETLSYLKNVGFKNPQLNYIVFFPKFLSSLRWSEPFLSWLPLGAQYMLIGEVIGHA